MDPNLIPTQERIVAVDDPRQDVEVARTDGERMSSHVALVVKRQWPWAMVAFCVLAIVVIVSIAPLRGWHPTSVAIASITAGVIAFATTIVKLARKQTGPQPHGP